MAGVGQSAIGFVSVSGSKLYYEVAGSGHPLVLVHGGGVDCRMWDDQFEWLASHFRVVRYDLRGHGKSPVGNQPYSPIDDLNSLLSVLGVDSTYTLGHSLGGGVVMAFTIAHPERVDALIIVSSGGVAGIQITDEEKQQAAEFFETVKSGDHGKVIDLFGSLWVDGIDRQAAPHVRERVIALLSEHAWPRFSPDFPGERWPEKAFLDYVDEIQAPTLFVMGEHDQPIFHRAADVYLGKLHDARRVIIKDAAHFVNMDQPELFNRAVRDFLSEQ